MAKHVRGLPGRRVPHAARAVLGRGRDALAVRRARSAVTARARPSSVAAPIRGGATNRSTRRRPARLSRLAPGTAATAFRGTSNTRSSVAPAYSVLSQASSAPQPSAAGNATARSRCPPPSVQSFSLCGVRGGGRDEPRAAGRPRARPPRRSTSRGARALSQEYVGTGGAVGAAGSSRLAIDHGAHHGVLPRGDRIDPPAANETALTALKCAFQVFTSAPVETSQTYTAPDSAPAAKCVPSGDAATTETARRRRTGGARIFCPGPRRPTRSSRVRGDYHTRGLTGQTGWIRYEDKRGISADPCEISHAGSGDPRAGRLARESDGRRRRRPNVPGARARRTEVVFTQAHTPRVRTRWSW